MKHAIAITLAGLALAACGGGDDSKPTGRGSSQAEFQKAQLDFARCMRKHGVDFPDPQPPGKGDGGPAVFVGPAPGTPRSALRKGEKECGPLLEKIRPPELSPEQEREFADNALEFARCMRGQGIDMPDPRIDGRRVSLQLPEGLAPGSPRLRKAEQACRRYQPAPPGEG